MAKQDTAAKRDAVEEYDAAFSCTANIINALLQNAGENELANRVRPSSRRTGQTNEVAEEAPPAAS